MEIKCSINDIDVTATLLVSDEVHEFMLGYDWLVSQGASWDFATKALITLYYKE